MDDCDFVQQLPMDWNAPSSPSTRMARPFWTMTLTPHSILPQPRQHVFTATVSLPDTLLYVSSASAVCVEAPNAAAAAPVMAAVLTNVRRDMVRLPILLLLLSPRSRLARLRSGDRGGGLPGEASGSGPVQSPRVAWVDHTDARGCRASFKGWKAGSTAS